MGGVRVCAHTREIKVFKFNKRSCSNDFPGGGGEVHGPIRGPDHSLPFSSVVTNACVSTSHPLYTFMDWCLIRPKHRFNFVPVMSV